ncbi:unnamed protein product [Lupinus luteus]|uniref:FAS1 domain-containing protein n=1 Tax=Lupinus luteus TaxID=3873 RepID=A0AAV1VX01_LUPLU
MKNQASGVIGDFNKAQQDAGITIFVPRDAAFARLPQSLKIQSLPADKKALVIEYHAIHSYYGADILKILVNPFEPTLATEVTNATSFRFSIAQFKGYVVIHTGIGKRSVVMETIYDRKPLAIYSVSDVLLPRDIFQ